MKLREKLREDCEGIRDGAAVYTGVQISLRAGQFDLVIVQAAQTVGDGGYAFAKHGSIRDDEGIGLELGFVLLNEIPQTDAADFFFAFNEDLYIDGKLAVHFLQGL